jgi:dynein heavy chain 2
MFRLLGLPRGTSLERLTFNNLLNVQQKVVSNLEKLKELNARAHGEISIREAIQELEMWAAQAEFALADYKWEGGGKEGESSAFSRHASGTSLKTVKEWKPVLDQVKNNQALLQSLRSSPYYAQFREQIQLWERKIGDLEQNLHHLNEIQRKWVYLEPIFGRGSLPAEAARFNRIDLEFRAILGDIGRFFLSFYCREERQMQIQGQPNSLAECRQLQPGHHPRAAGGAAEQVPEGFERFPGGEAERLPSFLLPRRR